MSLCIQLTGRIPRKEGHGWLRMWETGPLPLCSVHAFWNCLEGNWFSNAFQTATSNWIAYFWQDAETRRAHQAGICLSPAALRFFLRQAEAFRRFHFYRRFVNSAARPRRRSVASPHFRIWTKLPQVKYGLPYFRPAAGPIAIDFQPLR